MCARDWKQANPNGKLKSFEEFWQEVQLDKEKRQVTFKYFFMSLNFYYSSSRYILTVQRYVALTYHKYLFNMF